MAGALIIVIGAAVAAAAFWGAGPSLSEKALAAVGGGRVLHALLIQTDPSDVTVDLATGSRSPVRLGVESWFQEHPRKLHVVTRRNGHVLADIVGPGRVAPALRLFLTGYRQALREGRLRPGATTTLAGRRVQWLTVVSSRPRTRIAVDLQTYLPVLIEAGTSAPWTVIAIESVDPDHADFSSPQQRTYPSRGDVVARRPVRLRAAGHTLGWKPVSLGPSSGGLRLVDSAVERIRSSFAHSRRRSTLTLGLALTYRSALGVVDILEAKQALKAYRFGDGGLTFNFDPVPRSGAMQLAWLGPGGWIGQLRVGDLFVTIVAPSSGIAVRVARTLSPPLP